MRILVAVSLLLVSTSFVAGEDPSPKQAPDPDAIVKLCQAIYARDARAAQQVYDQMARDSAGTEDADLAIWIYSGFLLQQDRLDRAQELLLALQKSGRENEWVSKALLGLADVAQKRGDERAMFGYLDEAIKAPAAATKGNLAYTLATRQRAILKLARYYRDKRDFKKALEYFTRWDPKSGCGNCQASILAERYEEMTLCRLQLGDHLDVVREGLRPLQSEGWLSSFDAWVLCRLYRDAGQLDDLLCLLDEYDRTRKRDPGRDRDPTRTLRDLLRIEALTQKKDVAALVALCQDTSKGGGRSASEDAKIDPVNSAAAEALATLDGVEAVKAALAKERVLTVWLIYALGRSNAPAALEELTRLAEELRGNAEGFFREDNIAYALAMKGEAGKKILKSLAQQPKSAIGQRAKDWLEVEKVKAAWPEATWPRPKQGSLPRTWAEVREAAR
jgi:hypothetical protein